MTNREKLVNLKSVRKQMADKLMSTLARVGEPVTMMHLAKDTGAPAFSAEELVRQMASAVEELTDVDQRELWKASSIVTRCNTTRRIDQTMADCRGPGRCLGPAFDRRFSADSAFKWNIT